MAELVLSALLPVVFEKLADVAVNKIARAKGIDSELEKWKTKLPLIQAVLNDASQKEVKDEGVRDWLNGLQDLAYDIDDILDDITTRLQVLVDVKELIGLKNSLGLTVIDGGSKNKDRIKTSLEDEPIIVGREGDKKKLLQKLLGDEPCRQNFSIGISEVIYEGIGGENKEFKDLNSLQEALKNQLTGKRFLLVLDDVWSDKLADWKTLQGPFFAGASGSKIIITARKDILVKPGHNPYILHKLSWEDALSLFAQNALGQNNFDSDPQLRQYGEGIVQKCAGLPLALRALGRLLRNRDTEEQWKRIPDNEIWMLKDNGGILPELRLSYHDLSARLKQLFAYCCLIPKDHVFEKKDLILWWMAQGFLYDSATNETMEGLGEECFQELLSRSFFQHVPDDKSLFVMHDLMNDLATFVAGDFFSRLDIENEKNVKKEAFRKYRHMSFVCQRYMTYNMFEAFERANGLRTFLGMPIVLNSWQRFYLSSKILVDILPQLPLLRVLSLSRLEIDEVPECVGNMKHLRYLNLSQTRITYLPESVCNLYNLQTLIVCGCEKLTKLPDNFLKLINLRHFDIRDTLLCNVMPAGTSEMKSLQTLSNEVVEYNDISISGIKSLKNLQDKISINALEKVQSATDIQEVNLSEKRISELHMEWSDVFDDSRNKELEKEVLDALKPHSDNLKDLSIKSYGGKVFPKWIGDRSFLLLTSVMIKKCGNCEKLPPLGELPSLKKLVIQELNEVKEVGSEFLGTRIAFPKLESLRIEKLRGWEVWSTKSGVVGAVVFPCLEELYIKDCNNLTDVSLEALPSLRVLDVESCGDGVLTGIIRAASSVTELRMRSITGLSDSVWRGVMFYLGAVEELSIDGCNEIRYLWESEAEASKVLVNLRSLKVFYCSKLVSLGENKEEEDRCNQLTSLKALRIYGCDNLECCDLPNSIEELGIRRCDLIASVSFPTGGHKLKKLEINGCEKLLEKELLLTSMPLMLEVVDIIGWTNLKSINELTCFIHLTELTIIDCSSIESFAAADLPKLTSLKYLIIVNCKSMDVDSFGDWPPNLVSLTLGGLKKPLSKLGLGHLEKPISKMGVLQIGCLKKPISKLGPENFPPSLVDLRLFGGSSEKKDVTSGCQLSHMLPPSLTRLTLIDFEQLESVSKGLQHLTSLQHLTIDYCRKMKDLPEELLPSLLSLTITPCPDELKEKTSRRGSYWPLISYIPRVIK